MSLLSGLTGVLDKVWSTGSNIIKPVQNAWSNFTNSTWGKTAGLAADLYFNPIGTVVKGIAGGVNQMLHSPLVTSNATNAIKPNIVSQNQYPNNYLNLPGTYLGKAVEYNMNRLEDQAIARTIDETGKVMGIPTPGAGSGGVNLPSPQQMGLNRRAELNAAFPELNPWELAGGASGIASSGMAGSVLDASTSQEAQTKALQMQLLQMQNENYMRLREMSLRANIQDKAIRADLSGQSLSAGTSTLDDAIKYVEQGIIPEDTTSPKTPKAQADLIRNQYGAYAPLINASKLIPVSPLGNLLKLKDYWQESWRLKHKTSPVSYGH